MSLRTNAKKKVARVACELRTMVPEQILAPLVIGVIGLMAASCGKNGVNQKTSGDGSVVADQYQSIARMTDEEITIQVRKSLLDTLGKLTRHPTKPDVYISLVSVPMEGRQSKKAIAEFTMNPEKIKVQYSRKAPSQYQQENGIDVVNVDRIEGFTIRLMEDRNYPVLQLWSPVEAATDALAWGWEFKRSPEQNSDREIREYKLEAFPETRLGTLYIQTIEPDKATSKALDQFGSAIKRYFKETVDHNGEKSIIWGGQENRKSTTSFNTIAFPSTSIECRGSSVTLWETFKIDEEGRNAEIKQRGILEYVTGESFRCAERYGSKWSPWWFGMMAVRCYYQVSSSGDIEWIEKINKGGEPTIAQEPIVDKETVTKRKPFAPIEMQAVKDPEKVWRIILCAIEPSQKWDYNPNYENDFRPRGQINAPEALAALTAKRSQYGDTQDTWDWDSSLSSVKLSGWRRSLAAEATPGPDPRLLQLAPSALHAELSSRIPTDYKGIKPIEAPTVKAVLEWCKTR